MILRTKRVVSALHYRRSRIRSQCLTARLTWHQNVEMRAAQLLVNGQFHSAR